MRPRGVDSCPPGCRHHRLPHRPRRDRSGKRRGGEAWGDRGGAWVAGCRPCVLRCGGAARLARWLRAEVVDSCRLGCGHDRLPHSPGRDPLTQNEATPEELPAKKTGLDSGRREPVIECILRCIRNRDRPYAAAFAYQVRNDPAAFALLNVPHLEAGKFIPPQGAIHQHAQDRESPLADQAPAVRHSQEAFGFLASEPVTKPHSARRNPGHGQDASGFNGVEQIIVARLADKFADRRESDIDGGGAQALVDQLGAVFHQQGTADRTARLSDESEELIERCDVCTLRMRRYKRVPENPPSLSDRIGGMRGKEKRQRHRYSSTCANWVWVFRGAILGI